MAKKESRFFQKGHPGYYKGRTADADDFTLVFKALVKGIITLENGAEMMDVSVPTFRKWIRLVGEHGAIDRELYFLTWNDQEENQEDGNDQ